MRRRVVEDDDLEALDPTTGDALVGGLTPTPLPTGHRASWTTYRRRLRRARLVFIVLSFTSAGIAAYTGWSIATLRRVERTWRTAMAVDAVRQQTDQAIFDDLERFDPDDDTIDSFLVGVGVAATSELAKAETNLARQRIPDRRTAVLRDLMVEALEFRQRQMSPQRRQLGNTPLLLADDALATELRRWRLDPDPVDSSPVAAATDTLARLGRYADEPTSTILVALGKDGFSLLTIDIDGSALASRAISTVAERILAVAPDVVIAVGPNGASAYTLGSPSSSGPLWERPGATAFAVPGDDHLWLRQDTEVFRLRGDGSIAAGPFVLPPNSEPVGAAGAGLVLQSSPPTGNDDVDLWIPDTGRSTRLATGVRRVVGAGPSMVVAERRRAEEDVRLSGRFDDVSQVISDRGRTIETIDFNFPLGFAVQRPGGIEIAASGGPLDGNIARVFRFTLPGFQALDRPRASIEAGALAWSPDGEVLFWSRPDEGLAIHQPARRRQQSLRVSTGPVTAIVAFESQR